MKLNEDNDDESMIIAFSTIKSEVSRIAKDLDIDKVILFGSYVKGDASPLSDIDIYGIKSLWFRLFWIRRVIKASTTQKN